MQFLSSFASWFSKMMQGGALEIILLIVLVIVGLILFLVLLWLLWKILILLGKGLLWLFNWSMDRYGSWSQDKREARLSKPPLVSVGWGSTGTISLSSALSQARGLVGPDAATIVIVAGAGASDLCRSLGLTPPGVGMLGITAGGNTILIDASKADNSVLRKLARTLPWRRPVDGLVALVSPEGIPSESIVRSAIFARQAGMRIGLHFALPSTSKTVAWQVIDAQNKDGDVVCSQLAADAMRSWLAGGSREGMVQLALAQSRELPSAVNRALLAAPSSVVDVASLSFGGAGLRAAVAQTIARTRPDSALGHTVWVGFAIFTIGIVLTVLTVFDGISRTDDLRSTVNNASREGAVPWVAENINTVPSPAKIRRIAGLSIRLSEHSSFSPLIPLTVFSPNYDAPEELAAAFLTGYVLRPLADTLDVKIRNLLAPADDPVHWVEDARLVDEWFAAWQGLQDDPREVDLRRLLVAAFGGTELVWPEGTELAIYNADAEPPPAELGGLDIDLLSELARENFVATMNAWAEKVYTNGPIATAAKQASDTSTNWRAQHTALSNLRSALQDPSQQWMTAAKDKPEYAFEARVLGRAVGLSLFGQAIALRAKAEVSRIRLDARDAVEYFLLPGIGPIMMRSSNSSGDGSAVTLTKEVSAWLSFLDHIASSGFTDLPTKTEKLPVGLVTLDSVAVATARRKLESFDRVASSLPSELPPAIAQKLIRAVASELVAGITLEVEQSLRYTSVKGIASEQAQRLSQVKPAMDDLIAIEAWLRLRQAIAQANRVLQVRAKTAETVLITSAGVLIEEDPIGVYPDPAADGNALVRRYERGIERLRRIFEQYASPFIKSAASGSGRAALEWSNMEQDIAGYQRGDSQSILSGLEGMIRAYADDPVAACKSPRAALSGRDDYLARTIFRFRSELDYACLRQDLAVARTAYSKLINYFDRYVSWLWPYSGDSSAAELAPSTMAELISQIHKSSDQLVRLSNPFARDLVESGEFWNLDANGNATIKFRIDWRTRREEELLAEHIIALDIEGASVDENGNYTWRYGAPFVVRMKLAQNSPYRFIARDGTELTEKAFSSGGNGAWLRVLGSLTNGIVTFKANVRFDASRQRRARKTDDSIHQLAITARITHEDGRPMRKPILADHADYRLDLATQK